MDTNNNNNNNNNNNDNNNNDVDTELDKKKTMKTRGRVKIPLDQKIQKKANLQVTFSKRRQGLFRKASELSVLTGAQIAILVRSPAGKLFAFGSPSVDAVIGRYEGNNNCPSTEWQIVEQQSEGRRNYEKAARELEMLKEDRWWDKPIEAMDLEQLENYANELDRLAAAQFN